MATSLTYFNVPARAELTRLIFEDHGVAYQYNAVKDWASDKQKLSAEGLIPFGQVPLYQEGDFHLVQSHAITRYVAKKYGYVGSNAHEEAQIDSIHEAIVELQGGFIKVKYAPDEDTKEAELKTFVKGLPATLAAFEGFLKKNNGGKGFLVGDKISYADLSLYDGLGRIESLGQSVKDEVAKHPLLNEFRTRIGNRERIKAYHERKVYG